MDGNHFDLASFMPESLGITENATAPTRKVHSGKIHYYEDFVKKDPYHILNCVDFTPQPRVSEHIQGSEIQEFFRNANVLVTGGTGFVGKVLIEKLIRSVPNLKHIYLLVRHKRGKSGQERFKKLMEDQVFLRMQTEVPQYLSKITVVEGDISEAGLGLSAEDRQMLIDNVNIVFNSAADVKFLEPLKHAIESNVYGTKRMLELGKEMTSLKAFVHVSTAYSHCIRNFIEEKIYRIHTTYKEVINTLEETQETDLESTTKRIIQDWPNTYAFSKALCEQMIAEERENMPLCIVRPSIVLPTYKEPVRGWCDNLYGPMGITLGVGLGVLHSQPVGEEFPADFVPVDFLANFLLAAAWKTGSKTQSDEVTVYNYTATSVRATSWKEFIHFLLEIKDIWPLNQAVWYTSYRSTSMSIFKLFHPVFHTLPGTVLDGLAVMMGQGARLSKVYTNMYASKEQTKHFTNNFWMWQSDNVSHVWNEMGKDDQKLFEFDLASIDLKEHLLVSKLGMRYFFLKEKMETLPAAITKNNRLYWLHKGLQLTFGFTALKLMAIMSHYIPV